MKYLYMSLVLLSAVFAQTNAYVTLDNSNHVEVIDLTNHNIIKEIEVGGLSFAVATSFDGTRSYVSNRDPFPNSISAIDTSTHTAIGSGFVELNAIDMKVSAKGDKLYVVNNDSDSVSIYNTTTNTIIETIAVGDEPSNLAISPNGLTLYVTNSKDHNISVIDTITYEVIDTIAVGTSPRGIVIHPNGQTAYVVNNQDNTLSFIDLASHTVTDTINVGANSFELAISPDGSKLYITNQIFNGTVNVVDTTTYEMIHTLSVGNLPFGVAVSFDGSRLYVCNNFDSTIDVIDTSSYQTIDTISLGGAPIKIALTESLPVSLGTVNNTSFSQLEFFHTVRWTAPTRVKAVQYHIYRDLEFTKRITSTSSLEFEDHNRTKSQICSYFIAAEDEYENQYIIGKGTIECNVDL